MASLEEIKNDVSKKEKPTYKDYDELLEESLKEKRERSFSDSFKKRTNYTTTEKGATAHKTTESDLLDFFAQGGAMRHRDKQDIVSMFDVAFQEDPRLALKTLFYFRDIRGGQGERRIFRTAIEYLAGSQPEAIRENINLIPEYGRWDDIYALFDTQLEEEAAQLIKEQLEKDWDSENPSLLAKWLKSENASSNETKRLGNKTRKYLDMTHRQYRKMLSRLREKINVVEKKMSRNDWEDINYEKVPSKAGLIYKNAFERNDPERYKEYLERLEKGEANVNSDTLYPYELVNKAFKTDLTTSDRTYLNEAWRQLPDYIDGEENAIAVVDTSGSMSMGDKSPQPKDVALSLGLYMAERNKGEFHNKFITFSNQPEMIEVKGSNFVQKVKNMWGAHWDGTTDIVAVFDLILDIALENDYTQKMLPNRLYIISDMEFDMATSSWNSPKVNKTLFEKIENRYNSHDYDMPNLVFWNVNARNKQFPMKKDKRGVQLISGCSPSIFEATMKGEFMTPYEFMVSVIDSERYKPVTLGGE